MELWNINKGTITNVFLINVRKVVRKIINFWGDGKVKFNKKKQFYEQENLQLNIRNFGTNKGTITNVL